VRKTLSVPADAFDMAQPWVRKAECEEKSIPVALEYRFDVAALPQSRVFLAIESPKRTAIELNGQPVSSKADRGFWVDPSLRLISLDTASLCRGENRLIIKINYTKDDGLEIIYLLGDFGVTVKGDHMKVTEPPRQLKIGDWTKQGLPFYSGSVCYRRQIPAPRLQNGERLFVCVPAYRGVALRVGVDGKEAGLIAWEPNEVDITDLIRGNSFELGMEVLGHRRNSHGPLHHKEKWPAWTGPRQFVSEGKEWSDAYNLVPCGILKNPVLEVRRVRKA